MKEYFIPLLCDYVWKMYVLTQFLIYVNMCLSQYHLIFSNLGVPIGLRMAPEPQKSQPYLRILEQPKSNALR